MSERDDDRHCDTCRCDEPAQRAASSLQPGVELSDRERSTVPVPAWVWEMVTEVFDLYIDTNNDLVAWISTPDPWDGVQPVPFDITGLSRDESGRVIVELTDRLGSRIDGSHDSRWVEASLACGDWEFLG